MRIVALQMSARAGDVEANLRRIRKGVSEAKRQGADLLVAPELAVTGYGAGPAFRDLAEPADGAQLDALSAMARNQNLALVAGFAERAGDRVYNSAALIGPEGDRFVYRKSHLYGPYEREHFAPGDCAPTVFEFDGVRLGLLICYDVEFPEAVRSLALGGAELVLVPTALPEGEHAAFIAERVVPVRAFENQVCVVYANHAGSDGRFAYAGRSCIAMPDGSDAARAGPREAELILADYDPARFAASREANPYLADRRAELF